MRRPGALQLLSLLTAGIAAVSTGSVFVRLAAAPALAVAAYRVFWATLILAPFAARGARLEWGPLTRSDWAKMLAAGGALAVHFALWIGSLSYTSVASSVLLVDTTPFFVGLASKFMFGRNPGRPFWTGLAVAFAGCVTIFAEDWSTGANTTLGNALALGGAVAMAAYFLAGASLRPKLSLAAYVWPVYGSAAGLLALASLAAGVPLAGHSGRTHLFMFLLGLLPQSVGHTSYNWSLRWLKPELVALVSLAEPVGASLLAYLILGERLTWVRVLGGCIVLTGIYLSVSRQKAAGGGGAAR